MGFLDDLKKRMSAPGADRYSEERFRSAEPHIPLQEPSTQIQDATPPLLVDIEQEARRRRRRFFLSTSIVIGVLLIAGGTLGGIRAYRLTRTVQQEAMKVDITAPESVQSGSDVQYQVVVTNASRVEWQNVVLEAALPEGFTIKTTAPEPAATGKTIRWAVGTLRPRETGTYSVVGRLIGEQGTSPTLTATLLLTPENAPGLRLKKSQFVAVRVDAVPVDVAVEVPKEAASGERIIVRIAYQNRTSEALSGVRVVLTPPEGFVVEQTDPPVSGRDLAWDIKDIPRNGQGTLTVTGYVEGDPDAVRPFRAAIGFVDAEGTFLSQRNVQATTTIARRAITLAQLFNNQRDLLKANPGAEINARIQYTNSGNVGLRDLILTLTFTGVGLDPSTVETQGGFYDSQKNTITWTAASVEQLKSLAPGASGEVAFKFDMLKPDALPFGSGADKNFSVLSTVVADSPDIPTPVGAAKEVISDRFELYLNSVVGLEMDAFYDDGRAGLPSSTGPTQPRVGQESIYTVRARVTNTSNDIVDAVYRTVLPEGIRWTNKYYTTVGKVAYNERNREILWTIGAVPARAGIGVLAPEFSFQIGLTPSLNQVGDSAVLTKTHVFDGTDVFTAAKLHMEREALTTEHIDPQHAEVTP